MDSEQDLLALRDEIRTLKNRVEKLESTYAVAPRLPQTGLIADSFLRRSFTVWGHSFVASMIIMIPFYIIMGMLLFIGFFAASL